MKTYVIALLAVILLIGCTSKEAPFQAQLEQGILLMEGDSLTAPDTARAITQLLSAAEGGNSDAQYYLGYYFRNGIGVKRNDVTSLNWYKKSALAGSAHAQNKVGMIYYTGKGVEKEYGEALKWFTLSAKQDFDQAQYMLGKIYSIGRGVEPDTAKAINGLKKVCPENILIHNSSRQIAL